MDKPSHASQVLSFKKKLHTWERWISQVPHLKWVLSNLNAWERCINQVLHLKYFLSKKNYTLERWINQLPHLKWVLSNLNTWERWINQVPHLKYVCQEKVTTCGRKYCIKKNYKKNKNKKLSTRMYLSKRKFHNWACAKFDTVAMVKQWKLWGRILHEEKQSWARFTEEIYIYIHEVTKKKKRSCLATWLRKKKRKKKKILCLLQEVFLRFPNLCAMKIVNYVRLELPFYSAGQRV